MPDRLTFGVDFLTQQAKTKLDGLNRSLDKTDAKTKQGAAGFSSMAAKVALATAAVSAVIVGVRKLNQQLISLAKTGDHISDAARAFKTLGINIETLRRATGREISDIQLMEASINLLSRGLQASQDEVAEYIRLMKVMSDAGGESFDTLIMRGSRSRQMFDQLLEAARRFATGVSADIDSAGDAASRMETSLGNLKDALAVAIDRSETLEYWWSKIAGWAQAAADAMAGPAPREMIAGLSKLISVSERGIPRGLARYEIPSELRQDVEYIRRAFPAEEHIEQLRLLREQYIGQLPRAPGIPTRPEAIPAIPAPTVARLAFEEERPAIGIGRGVRRGAEIVAQTEAAAQAQRDMEEAQRKYAERLAAATPVVYGIADAMQFLTQTGNKTVDTIFAVAGALASILAETGGGAGKFFKGLGFQEGGTVPGPIGKPQLAVVHGGERVIPARESAGNLYTSVTFNVSAIDAQSVAEFFDRYGGHVARQVVKAADQSQAFRRRLM